MKWYIAQFKNGHLHVFPHDTVPIGNELALPAFALFGPYDTQRAAEWAARVMACRQAERLGVNKGWSVANQKEVHSEQA